MTRYSYRSPDIPVAPGSIVSFKDAKVFLYMPMAAQIFLWVPFGVPGFCFDVFGASLSEKRGPSSVDFPFGLPIGFSFDVFGVSVPEKRAHSFLWFSLWFAHWLSLWRVWGELVGKMLNNDE